MWFPKVIGILLIVFGCCFLGAEKVQILKKRIETLKEMRHALGILKNLTETYRLPLEIAFQKIYPQLKEPVSVFFEGLCEDYRQQIDANSIRIWQNNVKNMEKAFDKEDQMLFLNLGDFLGIQDIHMQTSAIEDCMEQIKQRVEILEKQRPEKEKLYKVLSFTLSGFLILIFL